MGQTRDALTVWAAATSAQLMAPLGRRAVHVRRVAELAGAIGPAFAERRDVLVAAALLHDIGYSGELASTGFHPADGAYWLRARGEDEVACLVAHHSGARHEAALRGFSDYESEFVYGASELDAALTYCDLTTGPDGRRVTLEQRIEEIHRRYGHDHVVARAMRMGWPEFAQARSATEQLMAAAGIELSGSLAYPGPGNL